jgi:hypothetical protein
MDQNLDEKISTELLKHDINIPDECRKRIDETISSLPDRVNKKWYLLLRPSAAIVVICLLMSSITVFAAIDYVRQRMASLSEEEKDSYYVGLQNSPANADSYSRKFSDTEEERMKELKEKYKNGTFPAHKLPVIKTQSDTDGSTEFYFVEDTSLFVLPSSELTEEELLEKIDFQYSRYYSLSNKAKENIATVSPDEFTVNGGMNEEQALELAKEVIGNIYMTDTLGFDIRSDYEDSRNYGHLYNINMKDKVQEANYGITIDADKKKVIGVTYFPKDDNLDMGIKVDRAKFIARYEEALDILTNKMGIDTPIVQSTCEYSSNSKDYLAYGIVNYVFEMEGGAAYVMQYSCINDVFYNIYKADYDKYKQISDQKEGKRKEKGLKKTIIQMQ